MLESFFSIASTPEFYWPAEPVACASIITIPARVLPTIAFSSACSSAGTLKVSSVC
jgi:hypothetical protein